MSTKYLFFCANANYTNSTHKEQEMKYLYLLLDFHMTESSIILSMEIMVPGDTI